MSRPVNRPPNRPLAGPLNKPAEPAASDRSPQPHARTGEEGSGTVWVAVWSLLPVCLAMVMLAYGAAVATRHRAAAAADSAALSAAYQASVGGQGNNPCAVARQVAAEHGASLTACSLNAEFADVVAESRPPLLLRPFGTARVAARAGPR